MSTWFKINDKRGVIDACEAEGKVWIPCIIKREMGMKELVNLAVNHFNNNRIVFSALLNHIDMYNRLRGFKGISYLHPKLKEWSPCLEGEWEVNNK
jgi:hypothetical protein